MSDFSSLGNPFLKRVIVKGMSLFLLVNLIFVWLNPIPFLGKISVYNVLFPGRVRLPYGEVPDEAYNLSLYSLEAMFNSHEVSAGDMPNNEYRVFLIGDSSVWGYLLEPENTLSKYISAANLQVSDGRTVRAYNLGYPTMSLAKDLLLMSYSLQYEPDLIIWLVTLESFPIDHQLDSPIVQNNPYKVKDLITKYSLNLNINDHTLVKSGFLDSTLIGQRRALADIIRLQLYGVLWAATGIDQYYPASYAPPQENLEKDESFYEMQPPNLYPSNLSFDILSAASMLAGKIPIIYVNEPIYISQGENSDIRYNFFYPQWAYDQYRHLLTDTCRQHGWMCLDEWDLVSADEFTNSAIHMTPQGTQLLATQIEKAILSIHEP